MSTQNHVSRPRPDLAPPTEANVTCISREYIADVQRYGDALDLLHEPINHLPFHRAMRAGLTTVALSVALLYSPDSSLPATHLIYGGVAATGSEGLRRLQRRRTGKKIERHVLGGIDELRTETQEPLELIRHGHHRRRRGALSLYWGAEFTDDASSEDARQQLEKVARLAHGSGLEQIAVPAPVLDFVPDSDEKRALEEKILPIGAWLNKKAKGRLNPTVTRLSETDKETQKTVLSLSPEECFALAELIEVEEPVPDQVNVFSYAWEMLRKERPAHVMFREYAQYFEKLASASQKNGIHAKARQTIANQLALTLDATTSARGPAFEKIQISLRGSIDRHQPIARLQGNKSLATTHGTKGYHAEETGSLLRHLGITDHDIRLFFESPQRLSEKQRVLVAETVLLYDLSGWQLPFEPENSGLNVGSPTPIERDIEPGLQLEAAAKLRAATATTRDHLAAITGGKQAIKLTEKQLASYVHGAVRCIGAVIFAGALLSQTGEEIINWPANYLYDQQQGQYIEYLRTVDQAALLERLNENRDPDFQLSREDLELLVADAEKFDLVPTELYDDFRAMHPIDPLNGAISNAMDYDLRFQHAFSDFVGNSGSIYDDESEAGQDLSQSRATDNMRDTSLSANVGNISSQGAQAAPLWKIESSGADTAGYWAQNTHNFLSPDMESGISWFPQENLDYKPIPLQDTADIGISEPVIKVSSVQGQEVDDYLNGNQVFTSIPVLEGTYPIAIQVSQGDWGTNESTPVDASAVQFENGTFGIVMPDSYSSIAESGKVTLAYWLAPLDDASALPYGSVHATDAIEAVSFSAEPDATTDLDAVSAAIDARYPDLPENGVARIEAVVRAIDETFNYELSPFEQGETPGLTEEKRARTIGEFAEIVLAEKEANCNVANTVLGTDNPEELNVVTGYYNKGANEQFDALSSTEGHLWTVDKTGQVHDATPSKGVDADEAEYFREDYSAEDFEPNDYAADAAKKRLKTIERIIGISILVGAAGIGYRKRKQLLSSARSVQTHHRDAIARRAAKQLGKILAKDSAAASSAIHFMEEALFSPNPSGEHDTTLLTDEEITHRLRINRLNSAAKPAKAARTRINKHAAHNKPAARMARRLIKLDNRAHR